MLTVHVLQVRLDEPGGGVAYVRMAMASDMAGIEMDEIVIDPARVRVSPVGWWRAATEIRRAVRRFDASILHAHGMRAAAAVALGTLRLGTVRVVTVHGLHSVRRADAWSIPFVRVFNRLVMRAFDRVMVVSGSDRDTIVEMRLAQADRIRLVRTAFQPTEPLGRDSARASIGLPPTGTVVLWMGRFSAEKDPLTFVRAVADLDVPDVTAVMVGDGPLLGRARSLATPVHSRVLFTGWLEHPGPVLAAADVFVGTSRWEGMPIAVLEAAAAGAALLLSDVPGHRDLVAAGVPAIIFPFGDTSSLTSHLHDVLARPHRATDLARSIVLSTYSRESLVNDLMNVYTEVWDAR